MNPRCLQIVDGLLFLALFVGAPLISAVIGYTAWKGKPKSFDRERFGLSAVSIGVPGVALMAYAVRMQADVRTPKYFWQLACFVLAVPLLGVAAGCFPGVLTYRRDQDHPNRKAKRSNLVGEISQ